MSFVNALMLLGLAAASIPFLIHLFHRQNVQTFDFSSVLFIRKLHIEQSRALKLRQLLILLLRAAIIALAVFGFARPLVEGVLGAWLGEGARQSAAVAIVLDNSYSMSAGGALNSPFSHALEKARAILGDMREGDEGFIVLTGLPPRAIPDLSPHPSDRLEAALDGLTPSSQSGDLREALALAGGLLSRTDRIAKEIYLITDLQRRDWAGLLDSSAVFPVALPIRLSVLPVTAPTTNNMSLDGIAAGEKLFIQNQPQTFTATYTNRSERGITGRTLDLYINGVKRGSQTVSAEPGRSGVARFNVTMSDPGQYSGYAELQGDDILADNRQYFAFTIPAYIRVGLIADAEAGYFLEQALSPAGGAETPVRVQRASAGELSGEDAPDALIVDTGIPLTTRQVSAIRDYVAGGGGLILFLGDRTDISVHNESLLPKLFGCSIQGRAGSPGQRGAYLSLTGMDYEHPIFRILKPSSAGLIDAPRFYASFRMSAATPSSVLARFSDGSPAMVEGKAGRGRALLFGSTVKTAWSDLSLKSLFVPLMHRGVRYVYRPEMVDQVAGKPGVPLERPVRWSPSTGGLTLVYPSGTTERVNPMVTPQGASVVVTGTEEPGIYRIQAGDDLLRVFTVNVDTGESEPERLSHEEAEQRIGAVQGRLITGEIASEATVFQSPDGYEIWKSLIFLALVLLLLEAWLTRLPTAPKERTG